MATNSIDSDTSHGRIRETVQDNNHTPEQEAPELQQTLLEAAETILSASHIVVSEVETFTKYVAGRTKHLSSTGLPAYLRRGRRVQTNLQRLVQDLSRHQLSSFALHPLGRTLNLCAVENSHICLHWSILKRCHSFVAINRAFQGSQKDQRKLEIAKMGLTGREKQLIHRTMKGQAKIEVHVVEGGAEWIDVRTLQPDRLAKQMTDNGWAWEDHNLGDAVDAQEWEDVPLARQVKRLIAAARMNRHEYRLPRLRIVLPNIGRDNKDIRVFLDQLSRLDPSVEVIIDDQDSDFLQGPSPVLKSTLENLLGNELDGLTETLNIDHTVLIDLISDITHWRHESQSWQAETTRAQIEEEKRHDGLMVKVLYPVLEGRKLVCTQEAAEHFHEVLCTVGTESERERGQLLVPMNAACQSMSPVDIRHRLQELSIYALPDSVQVPITILSKICTQAPLEETIEELGLPKMAFDVARCCGFKTSKLSTFMYGWASGNMTLTSDKGIKGYIKTLIETHRQHDDDYGPSIWRINTTRNLLSKHAWPMEGGVI